MIAYLGAPWSSGITNSICTPRSANATITRTLISKAFWQRPVAVGVHSQIWKRESSAIAIAALSSLSIRWVQRAVTAAGCCYFLIMQRPTLLAVPERRNRRLYLNHPSIAVKSRITIVKVGELMIGTLRPPPGRRRCIPPYWLGSISIFVLEAFLMFRWNCRMSD